MKKLLFLFPLFFTQSIFSQENWHFATSAGLNLVPIQESDISGTTFKGGLSFAFTSSHTLEEHISFDYGLSFNQRYASYNSSSVSDELTGLINIGPIPGLGAIDLNIYENVTGLSTFWTIDLPLTMTYKFNSGVILYGGGYVNYLLTVKTKEQTETHIPVFEVINPADLITDPFLLSLIPKNQTVTETTDSKENMRDLGYGLLMGIGYETDSWVLKLGYQHGLSNIRSDDVNMKFKNQRAINLSLGLLIQDLFYTSKEKPIYDLQLIE